MPSIRTALRAISALVLGLAATALPAQIRLHVDLTDAPRNIYHAHLQLPAKPGEMTLVFPKWIPGNHRPSGPIGAVTGVHFQSNGQEIPWKRDDIDMYAFHVTVPAGATQVEANLDAITLLDSAGGGGPAASSDILDLNWNAVVLYPANTRSDDVQFIPSVTLPKGWRFGTALPGLHATGDNVEFAPVALTTLIDSPLIAGAHYKQIALDATPNAKPAHVLDLVADAEQDLAMSAKDEASFKKLVAETGALFQARHYRGYHFLLTLSNQVGGHGLEHHESNDSAASERFLLDPAEHLVEAGLVPHEFAHSWNGKYRRPAGLATPNYQEPMVGDLLWVYEGMTDYLGNLLAARSGFWTPEQYRESLAATAAMLDHRTGRTWRPLEDTGRSVQTLRMMGGQWLSWRRGLDYYPEGELIWLQVDSIIRQQTKNQRSLDDFCRRFHGNEKGNEAAQSGQPKVVPYTFEDVVSNLNAIAPYDWAKLLKDLTQKTSTHAPLAGIENDGWKLVYSDKPNPLIQAEEKLSQSASFAYTLGFSVNRDGKFSDVIVDSPAYKAGIGPAMKLVAVNGRKWSPGLLHVAIREAKNTDKPIDLLIENAQFIQTYSVNYHEGEKNPHLERVTTQPDYLEEVTKPLTH